MHLAPTLFDRHTRDVTTMEVTVYVRRTPSHMFCLPVDEVSKGFLMARIVIISGKNVPTKSQIPKSVNTYRHISTQKQDKELVHNSQNKKKENDAHTKQSNSVKEQKYSQGVVHRRKENPVKTGVTQEKTA